jgi:glycosyltransferase involved in cell wall biosynthesis
MDLSILIPARNEIFTARTVQDILEHIEADTEIIVALDGAFAEPPLPQHERVTVLYFPKAIGQRAATNRCAAIAKGKYIMKVDAHCAFAQGFDRILLADMQDDWTVAPTMKNLHAFDWVCKDCGQRTYQGAKKCGACKSENVEMDVVWIAKPSPNSTAFRFDKTLHFQYWNDFRKRPEAQGDIAETMSLQGSCWMLTKQKYFELNICDEEFGSWGQQGVEVACKTWLSGGRVMVNKKTWYAHMFRTQEGFTFPYPISGSQVQHARELSRELFLNDKWAGAKRPFQWILDHFAPVPDWWQSAGVVYYTDNRLPEDIAVKCQRQLRSAVDGLRIVSVSLQPMDFGDNIVLPLERGYLAMFKQILAGLKELETDVVFFAEHDVMYHPSHFKFRPVRDDVYYYNTNVWKVRQSDGHALFTEDCRQTSGLCANRHLLIRHYEERVRRTEAKWNELGDSRTFRNWIRQQGFEPGTHNRPERVDDFKAESWQSEQPNMDIRHEANLTPSRWRKDEFRNQKYTRGWREGYFDPSSMLIRINP